MVAVLAAAALFLAVAGGVVWRHRTQSSAAVLPKARAAASAPAATDWLALVRRLESARARAFTTGDPSLLEQVYVEGSAAQSSDVARLRQLAARHLRVRGFAMAALRAEVLGVKGADATLQVTEEISAFTLSDGRTIRHIAATRPRTFTMQLAKQAGLWRIAVIHP